MYFYLFLKIYLREGEYERAGEGAEGEEEKESQADSLWSVEPSAELDLGTLRSRPVTK